MRHSNLEIHGTAGLRSSFSSCVFLAAIAVAVLAAPSPASAAAPEIAVFTGDTTNAATARTNGADFIFPNTTLGYSSTAIFTIKNVGDANLSGLALIQSGANPTDYPPSGLTATDLAPNGTATFSVNFEPSGEGLRTAAISIASNDADENPFVIKLRGTGTPLQITQQPVDASVGVGSTAQFAAFGGPLARYQWQRRLPGATTFVDVPSNIPFATSSNFVTAPVTVANDGTAYRCIVSKGSTILFSSEALLSVDFVAIVDASVSGDPVTGTSINSPSGQLPPRAIDNNVTTKYLNFDKLNTGLIITPFGKGPVHALTLISAEDEPARDPSSFVLEGSLDGTNFTRIASNAVPEFPERHFIQSFAVPNTNVFNHYRVRFPTVADAATANSMQIAEVELLYHEEITSPNDSAFIFITPPSAQMVRPVDYLFDRELGPARKLEVQFTSLLVDDIVVDLTLAAGARVLKGFELIGAADDFTYPERRPSRVTVEGSTDGSTYTHLATVVPAAPSSNLQIQEFATTSNTTAFAHYRITFGPPVDGQTLQVGEMRLFGEAASVTLPPPVLSIRANSNNVLVSWPDNPGFILEAKTSLTNATWTPVGTMPVLNNGVNTVTLPKSGDVSFFRLRK